MKEPLLQIERDTTVNVAGNSVTTAKPKPAGHIVRAAPKRLLVDGEWVENTENVGEYIRLHLPLPEPNYLWNAPLDDWNESVSIEPGDEPRWEAE